MRFSKTTSLYLLKEIMVNLTSGWFGVLFVSPGFFGKPTLDEYFSLLIANLPFAIVGLVISYLLIELERRR